MDCRSIALLFPDPIERPPRDHLLMQRILSCHIHFHFTDVTLCARDRRIVSTILIIKSTLHLQVQGLALNAPQMRIPTEDDWEAYKPTLL
jgi:hypothetical protein